MFYFIHNHHLQHVFYMLKHLEKCFTDVLQHFCKRFTLKHLKNILRGGYM